MTRHWSRVRTHDSSTVSSHAVVALLEQARGGPPALAALRFIGHLVPMDYVSMVEYAPAAMPRQVEGHARNPQGSDTTARCFSLYRAAQFFQRDEVVAIAADMASANPSGDEGRVDVFHYRQRDIPDRDWRGEIFVREQLAGRVSLILPWADGRVHALNFYRHTGFGEFDGVELERICAAAPIIRAALQPRLQGARPASDSDRLAQVAAQLARRCAALTRRELEALSRVVLGWSTDAIAEDLGIAASTVVTLKKRAYVKLNVHNRMALAWSLGMGDIPCQSQGTDVH